MKKFYFALFLSFLLFPAFSQKVGVGTATPQNTLDVKGGMAVGTNYAGTEAAPSNGIAVQGNVAIGQATATEALEVNGRIAAKGFKNTILTAQGASATSLTVPGAWTDIPDMSLSFSLGAPTTVVVYFNITLGAQNGVSSYIAGGLDIDGAIYAPITQTIPSNTFGSLNNQHTLELTAGNHTIKAQYFSSGGLYTNAGGGLQERRLQVLVFGSN